MEVPDTIECVDCGQTAHLLSYPPDEGWQVGDYVAYRCSGCNDRWDLVVTDGEEKESAPSYSEEAQAILRSRQQDSSSE